MKTQETAVTGEGNAPREEQDPYCDFCKDAIADEIQKDYEHVKAQRDELLAVLKAIRDYQTMDAKEYAFNARDLADAAVANAERNQ